MYSRERMWFCISNRVTASISAQRFLLLYPDFACSLASQVYCPLMHCRWGSLPGCCQKAPPLFSPRVVWLTVQGGWVSQWDQYKQAGLLSRRKQTASNKQHSWRLALKMAYVCASVCALIPTHAPTPRSTWLAFLIAESTAASIAARGDIGLLLTEQYII